jgi:hypothetical protein
VLVRWSGTGDRVGMPVSTGTVTHRPTTECEGAVQATTGGGAKDTTCRVNTAGLAAAS